jgi:hypothetical protein
VSDRSIDRRFGAGKVGYFTGPPGVASTDDTSLLAWNDTRNGNEGIGTRTSASPGPASPRRPPPWPPPGGRPPGRSRGRCRGQR